MSGWINNTITCTAIGLLVAASVTQRSPSTHKESASVASALLPLPTAPVTPLLQPAPATPSKTNGFPRRLQFDLSISSPQDLKVKQGDQIVAGQVLADRVEERSRLTSQRQALRLSLQQIEGARITTPPTPAPVPGVNRLPPISYAEEETAIASAGVALQQAERAFQMQQQSLKSEPLAASASVQRAAVEVQNRQRLVDNQKRKLDAVAMLKHLPASVMAHEQEVLKHKEAELQQALASYQQAQSQLSEASKTQTEKLQQLAQALEKARADQQLAIARLQTKKDQRAHTEYEASVTAARRTEERNQAQQSYSQQTQAAEQQQRDRNFQVAQLKAKISEVDNQLSAFTVITSPYAGTIKRIKFTGQNEQNLLVQITLSTASSSGIAPSPRAAVISPGAVNP